jgi:hypothetical protein
MGLASDSNSFTSPGSSDTPSSASNKDFGYWIGATDSLYFWRYADSSAPGKTVRARLWSDANKDYYCYWSVGNGWNSDPGPTTIKKGANDWYGAFAPYKPRIKQFEESTTTPVGGTATFTLNVSGVQGSGSTGKREITETFWKWGTDPALADASTKTVQGGSLSLDDTQATQGTTLYFQLFHGNWFSSEPVGSNIEPYTVGGGVGGVGGAFNYTLLPAAADKLVINSITIPSNDLTIGAANTASEFAAVLNEAAGEDKVIVAAIYKWDAAAGKPVGVTFDTDGKMLAGSVDFDLVPGEGIQVYTTEPLDVTLEGR